MRSVEASEVHLLLLKILQEFLDINLHKLPVGLVEAWPKTIGSWCTFYAHGEQSVRISSWSNGASREAA